MEKHWLEPGDIEVQSIDAALEKSAEVNEFWVSFADGLIAKLRRGVPANELSKLAKIDETNEGLREEFLSKYSIEKFNCYPMN